MGARKLRWAVKGRGKSGEIRVITFTGGAGLPVFLLAAFGKGEKVNLTGAERNQLRNVSMSGRSASASAYPRRNSRPGSDSPSTRSGTGSRAAGNRTYRRAPSSWSSTGSPRRCGALSPSPPPKGARRRDPLLPGGGLLRQDDGVGGGFEGVEGLLEEIYLSVEPLEKQNAMFELFFGGLFNPLFC